MEISSIINDNKLTNKMQDIYKYIDKNHDKFNDIFNRTYDEIEKLYPDTWIQDDIIDVENIDSDKIFVERDNCMNILTHHAEDILQEYSYLMNYVFKINVINNNITIIKKH